MHVGIGVQGEATHEYPETFPSRRVQNGRPKEEGASSSMRELRVPRGMRKNAGQFIGIHFVLPHAVRPIMIVRVAVDLCLRPPLRRLIFHQLSFSAFSALARNEL